jgi:hypothetical protein
MEAKPFQSGIAIIKEARMSDQAETGRLVDSESPSFLAGKPIWVYWIVHTFECGALFGISYLVIYLLALQWWVAVIAVVAAGMGWGSLTYRASKPKKSPEPERRS